MGLFCLFGHHDDILKYGLVMTLMISQIQSAFHDAIFNKVPLQEKKLELYETGKASSLPSCALMCSRKRVTLPACQAFGFNPLTNECYYYRESPNAVVASSLHVFLFQIHDRVNAVAIGDEQFYIYVSSEKRSFYHAQTGCGELGGYLLQFDSMTEYDAVRAVTTGDDDETYIIGITDVASEGDWVTDMDNTPLDTDIWLWADGAPDNYYNEDCAVVMLDLTPPIIGDISCFTGAYVYLCERNA